MHFETVHQRLHQILPLEQIDIEIIVINENNF